MIQHCRTGQFQVHDTLPLRLRYMQGFAGMCAADRQTGMKKSSRLRLRLDIEVEEE